MADDLAIQAIGLHKRYGDTVALADATFEVPRGTVCGLLGPNGAGKTTTVRLLTTLTAPDAGSARVAGIDVQADPEGVRRRIGLAAQDATVDGLLTGRENLVMMGDLHHLGGKVARVRAGELLEQFALTDAADRPVKTYSGGMRRRLDLAATLVSHPEILFLDEPTTGLDPRARTELWDVLETLVDTGTTILLTTQYLEEADRLADDIIVVDHGRVIARGDAAALKGQVGGSQLFATLERREDLATVAELMRAITGGVADIDADARQIHSATDAGPRAVSQLADALAERGIAVDDMGLRRPTLDEVFLTLTGQPIGDGKDVQ